MKRLAPYYKAIVGFFGPAVVVLGSAATPASDGGTAITPTEWVTAAVACVLTAGGVYGVTNKPAPKKPTAKKRTAKKAGA